MKKRPETPPSGSSEAKARIDRSVATPRVLMESAWRSQHISMSVIVLSKEGEVMTSGNGQTKEEGKMRC